MAGDYQDRHRYFLQAIMVQRLVTERKAQDMYQRACQLYNGNLITDSSFYQLKN